MTAGPVQAAGERGGTMATRGEASSAGGGAPEEDRSADALRAMLHGHRRTQMLYVAAKLGLADLLREGPKGSVEVAGALSVDAQALHRLLRGLVVLDVLAETPDGRFALGPL